MDDGTQSAIHEAEVDWMPDTASDAVLQQLGCGDIPISNRSRSKHEDFTHVKFYRYSLRAVVERQSRSFDRFVQVDDWVPPVVRTATKGDDPLRAP